MHQYLEYIKNSPYVRLARLDKPIGIWLLLFPCWWGIMLSYHGIMQMPTRGWGYILLFAIGAVLMRSAGCVINDLWDQELDRQVERTKNRPLAAKEITVPHALIFLGILLGLSFLVLIFLPSTDIILGFLSLGLVAVYPLMKRWTWWPQAFLGLTFNWGALMGGVVAGNGLNFSVCMLYLGGVFWTLGYDTIYAHQDKNDDALIGIKSTARLFGAQSQKFVAAFYALAMACFVIAKYSSAPTIATLFLILPMAGYTIQQLRSWKMDSPEDCLRVFKTNQIFGWLVLLMLAF
jgi:4-hydroxybenzoate polyprenyltransferase